MIEDLNRCVISTRQRRFGIFYAIPRLSGVHLKQKLVLIMPIASKTKCSERVFLI